MKFGDFLTQIIGKTVDKIYQVDFNNEKENDEYLPWLFFITFIGLDKFLEIEGDFDGDHITINLYDLVELNKKLKKNDLRNEPNLWRVYEVNETDTLGILIDKPINKCEYGVDRKEFMKNVKEMKGKRKIFSFIKFYLDKCEVTIFEGGCGLFVSNDPNVKLNFENTFDKYKIE